MMVLLLTVSAVPATASGSADEPMKPKSSGGDKAGSKKEKEPKKDKIDKLIDEVDEARKQPSVDKEKSDKAKDSEGEKDKPNKESKDNRDGIESDYEGRYRSDVGRKIDVEFKLKKAKKGPLYSAKGWIRFNPDEFIREANIYTFEGTFYPKSGELKGEYKPYGKKARRKGDIDGKYEDGQFEIIFGGLVRIPGVVRD
jgi:hypothetical protein